MTREISCVECVVGRFKDNLCEEKICKRFSRKGSSEDFEGMITNMVEVVRCKDCKHYSIEGETTRFGWCGYWNKPTDEMRYCSDGERREP